MNSSHLEDRRNSEDEAMVKKKTFLRMSPQFWIKLLALLALIGVILVAVFVFKLYKKLDDILDWINDNKAPGFFIFSGVYMLLTAMLIPGSILSVGAGFALGIWLGSLAVLLGATVGQTIAFLEGRFFFREWIAKKTKNFKIWQAIEAAAETEGWKIVALLRLAPLLPYNALNPALGLTAVKFWDYAIASAFGIIPGTVMYVYFGSLVNNIADITNGEATKGKTIWIGIATGVVIILVVILTTYYAKKAIRKKLDALEAEEDADAAADADSAELGEAEEIHAENAANDK